MAYSEKTKQLIADAPPSLGTNLAQWAVQRGVSVQQVATATGATRQTVYNWFIGMHEPSNELTPFIEALIKEYK